jgi:hypothetical protein
LINTISPGSTPRVKSTPIMSRRAFRWPGTPGDGITAILLEVLEAPDQPEHSQIARLIACKIQPVPLRTYQELDGIRMSDNRLDGFPTFNRVSVHAVLVSEGEDPGPALLAVGILDPIAIPVVLGEEADLSGGLLGDGITPNLAAVLETEDVDDLDSSPTSEPDKSGSQPGAARPVEPANPMLPPAFGLQPLARVRQLGDRGLDPPSGRYGNGVTFGPPSPGRSLQVDAIVNAGQSKQYSSAGNNPSKNVNPSGLTTEDNPD